MRYLSRDEFATLVRQGRVKPYQDDARQGILTINLPEPGGAIVKEGCMAVKNPPVIGIPLPKNYQPILID